MEGKAIVKAWSIWLFPIQYVCCPSLSLVVLLQEVSLKTSVFVYYSTCHSTDSCPLSMAFLVYTQIIYSSLSHDVSTFKFIHSVCLIKSPSFGIFLSLKSSVLLSRNYIFFPQSAFYWLRHCFQSCISLSSLCPNLTNIDISHWSLYKFSSHSPKLCVPPIRTSLGEFIFNA